jgi:hypothetical protein
LVGLAQRYPQLNAMNLEKYLIENFKGYNLSIPAFYQWHIGIRFELSSSKSYQFLNETTYQYNESYFEEVKYRAMKLFKAAFGENDEVFVVYQISSWKRQRIRKFNHVFRQINDLDYSKIEYQTLKKLYDPEWFNSKYKRAIIKVKANNIEHENILEAISNQNFPPRKPNINGEVFFVNSTRNIILNMYDDRGLDIIANKKETLESIYKEYNEWILDYDREKIDSIFKPTVGNKN